MSEHIPLPPIDPCAAAYNTAMAAIEDYKGRSDRIEPRVLLPVMQAAYDTGEQFASLHLSRNERHRLHSELMYDTLCRMQAAGELSDLDTIAWRQTDRVGEEWVEYTDAEGTLYALNCPGLQAGIGGVEKNKVPRIYDRLFGESYLIDPDYSMVKRAFEVPRGQRLTALQRRARLRHTRKNAGRAAVVGTFGVIIAGEGYLYTLLT